MQSTDRALLRQSTAAAAAAAEPTAATAAQPPALLNAAAQAARLSAAARRASQFAGLCLPLERAHRLLSERSSYAHAALASFPAALHASPARRVQAAAATASRARGDASPAGASPAPYATTTGSAAAASAVAARAAQQPLSYAAEQAMMHDTLQFLHTLSWVLRMPLRVYADACVSVWKYASLVPLQRAHQFVIAAQEDSVSASATPTSSPPYAAGSSAPGSSAVEIGVVSSFAPHALYILATAALFLSCKAMDTPRKLNDFVDAHIALANMLQRIRKSQAAAAAAAAGAAPSQRSRKGASGLSASERVRALWTQFNASCTTPSSALAPAGSAFHPSTLALPSANASFVPNLEWSSLRESVVYAEFLLLTQATEFAFNNIATCLAHAGAEGSPFLIVQRLALKLIEQYEPQAKAAGAVVDLTDAAAEPASSHLSFPLRFSRLSWMLTHASLRSSVYLCSNAYTVAIAIVFLTAQRFTRKTKADAAKDQTSTQASTAADSLPTAAAASADSSMSDVPAASRSPADGATPTAAVTAMHIDSDPATPATPTAASAASSVIADETAVDLDALMDQRGWAPSFRVVDGGDSAAPSAAQPRLCWYHSLCPTLTEPLLLSLCELIMEAAIAAPPLLSTAASAGDAFAAEVQCIAESYPWALTDAASAASSISHAWSNAASQTVVRRSPSAEPYPYEEPHPPVVYEPARGPLPEEIATNEERREDQRRASRRRSKHRRHSSHRRSRHREREADDVTLIAPTAAPAVAAAPPLAAPTAAVPSNVPHLVPTAAATYPSVALAPATHFVHPSRLAAHVAAAASTASQHVPAAAAASLPPPPAPLSRAELIDRQVAQAKELVRLKAAEAARASHPSATGAAAMDTEESKAQPSTPPKHKHGDGSRRDSTPPRRHRSRSRSSSGSRSSYSRSSSRSSSPHSSSRRGRDDDRRSSSRKNESSDRRSSSHRGSSSRSHRESSTRDRRRDDKERDRDRERERDRAKGSDQREKPRDHERDRSRGKEREKPRLALPPPPPPARAAHTASSASHPPRAPSVDRHTSAAAAESAHRDRDRDSRGRSRERSSRLPPPPAAPTAAAASADHDAKRARRSFSRDRAHDRYHRDSEPARPLDSDRPRDRDLRDPREERERDRDRPRESDRRAAEFDPRDRPPHESRRERSPFHDRSSMPLPPPPPPSSSSSHRGPPPSDSRSSFPPHAHSYRTSDGGSKRRRDDMDGPNSASQQRDRSAAGAPGGHSSGNSYPRPSGYDERDGRGGGSSAAWRRR